MMHIPIRYWFISQACLAMVLLTAVEAVLMLRGKSEDIPFIKIYLALKRTSVRNVQPET